MSDGPRIYRPHESSSMDDIELSVKVGKEIVTGSQVFKKLERSITVFGSARYPQEHEYCHHAEQTGTLLAQKGFTVITGGGPGIMEAVSRGAHHAGGTTVAANIQVPHEQRPNPYIHHVHEFQYFFVRKLMMINACQGILVYPGGMGTMDELFETMTLIQTKKSRPVPVILMIEEYWSGLLEWLREKMVGSGALSQTELDHMRSTDDPGQALSWLLGL